MDRAFRLTYREEDLVEPIEAGATFDLQHYYDSPERYRGTTSTANLFDVLQVHPLMGRTFREGDDLPGAERVILLGFDETNRLKDLQRQLNRSLPRSASN